jgi:hypothetical protein
MHGPQDKRRTTGTLRRVRRVLAYTVAIGAIVVVAAPAFIGRDSFPLSDYPMFADDRGRESSIATAVGITTDGDRTRLSPELIGGTDEPVLAAATAERATASATGAATFCDAVAARAAGRDDLRAIEVVTERYDTVAYFESDEAPETTTVHARCQVESS